MTAILAKLDELEKRLNEALEESQKIHDKYDAKENEYHESSKSFIN